MAARRSTAWRRCGTLVAASWAQPRFAASVVSGFAVLAMALAGIGLYGALSYSVSQRRRELGVRAALGATRGALVGLVLREGVWVTLLGVGLGVVAAGLLTRLMTRLLFGTSPLDALSFPLGPALLDRRRHRRLACSRDARRVDGSRKGAPRRVSRGPGAFDPTW